MNKNMGILLIALLITSCITYPPIIYPPIRINEGYGATQLDEKVFAVYFTGNSTTNRQRAWDFALLRAAELAIAKRFIYFVILDFDQYTKESTYKTPEYSRAIGHVKMYRNSDYAQAYTRTHGGQTYDVWKPRSAILIMCFSEKQDNIDATFLSAKHVANSIREHYGIK